MKDNKSVIYAVAVSICDNDFNNTFIPILEAVQKLLKHLAGSERLTHDLIETFIVDSIQPFYVAYQYNANYCPPLESTVEYLKEKIKVFFNDEAFLEWQNNDHDDGSYFLDVVAGKVLRY